MNHALSRPTPLGGAEMRATVRELPRDGRGRAAFAACRRSCRVVHLKGTFGGSSTAEHSAVNRRVVGSNPTPRASKRPVSRDAGLFRTRTLDLPEKWLKTPRGVFNHGRSEMRKPIIAAALVVAGVMAVPASAGAQG